MFDIGAQEVLLIVVVAILVIGPKDMPAALRQAGRWIGKMRRMSGHLRTGLDAMVREAEMEEMEKKWKAQNEKIMRQYPDGGPQEMEPTGAYPPPAPKGDPGSNPSPDGTDASAESAAARIEPPVSSPAATPSDKPSAPTEAPPAPTAPPADKEPG